MPLPRFERLPADKRERILEAAAEEFGAHGYEKASLNRILDRAGISKGAAYYYFADKADLIATVLQRYWLLQVAEVPEEALDRLSADEFWRKITDLLVHPFEDLERRPWLLGLSRAVWELPRELLEGGPLKSVFDGGTAWVASLVSGGRTAGALRTDLPESLVIQILMTLDSLHDRWLGARWQEMTRDERERFTATFVSLLRRMLEPIDAGGDAEGRNKP